MMQNQVQILEGNSFVVSDQQGDIDASPTEASGLFSFDTRFLSKWILTIDGKRLDTLSTDDLHYFETRFFLVPESASVYTNVKQSIIRRRQVREGFHETITVMNHDDRPVALELGIEIASDFADLFEVKDAIEKRGSYSRRIERGSLVLGYRRDNYICETWISASEPARIDDRGMYFDVKVDSHDEWSVDLDVLALPAVGPTGRPAYLTGGENAQRPEPSDPARGLDKWIEGAPLLECDNDALKVTYRRCLEDLAALRFATRTAPDQWLPAAGLPWFMTIFGRDSIFTSLQSLPFTPELAHTTLIALGERQGTRVDDFREEDPGRILHEMRYGEMTAFEERPQSPYYGNADATMLYVILLDEYERWTGDAKLVEELEVATRAAINWIDEYADLQGNGYVSYQRRTESGLENQCWKDSWDSISYHNGQLPGFPRATAELQGYAYDAKLRAARLARLVWKDIPYAERLEEEAADFKRRFNKDFWLDDRQYYALAIERDGGVVDALASNMGHLLWSGIVDKAKAKAVADKLMSPALFSGWGVRTLATTEARFNPIGYHTGTVWPFDNSIIAWGLRRYGFRDEAARIASATLEAAVFFQGRLPEAFGGYERAMTRYPVEYPTACSPQAWSTGAPLLLLRTMLGLEPVGDNLIVDPAIPVEYGTVQLLDIPGRWGKIDAFGRGRVAV